MSFVNQSIIKHKPGLLNLAEELGNVSQAAVSWAYRAIRFTASKKPKTMAASRRYYIRTVDALISPNQRGQGRYIRVSCQTLMPLG